MVEMPDGPNHDWPGGHSRRRGGHPQGLFQWKSEEHRLHSGPGLEMDSWKSLFCYKRPTALLCKSKITYHEVY